jgi:methylphosphotriester-DNA--protein-cysteine methyltransferase
MTAVMPPGPPRHRLGGYREYAPPWQLERYVDSLWIHRAPEQLPAGPGARHRVLPDPALSLAFSCRRDPDGRPLDPAVVIIGPKHRPHIFAFQPGRELAAVRVKLEWSAPLLDLEPGDHGDAERDLATVHPRLLAQLLEPLADTREADEAASLLAGLIARRGARLDSRDASQASRALELVRRSAGAVSVDRAAARLGVPLRTLHRAVRRDAGLSLKRFARVTRLVTAVTHADRSTGPSWAAIAAESGFCDQSHLVRECRAIAGLAPGEIHRERRAQEAETSNLV